MTTKKTKSAAAKFLAKGLSSAKKKLTDDGSHSHGNRGLIARLFDFSFSEFVAVSVIKIIYAIGMIALALGAVGQIYTSFQVSTGKGFGVLLLGAPIGFILSVLLLRVALEGIIVIFRIGENIQKIADGEIDK